VLQSLNLVHLHFTLSSSSSSSSLLVNLTNDPTQSSPTNDFCHIETLSCVSYLGCSCTLFNSRCHTIYSCFHIIYSFSQTTKLYKSHSNTYGYDPKFMAKINHNIITLTTHLNRILKLMTIINHNHIFGQDVVGIWLCLVYAITLSVSRIHLTPSKE
jgi:hypothetical protein